MRWLIVAMLLARCGGWLDCELVRDGWGPAETASVKAEKIVDGLEVPWGIAFLPGGGDFLVTERPGRMRLVSAGALVPQPVATMAVSKSSEAGLLGIALHPEFATGTSTSTLPLRHRRRRRDGEPNRAVAARGGRAQRGPRPRDPRGHSRRGIPR